MSITHKNNNHIISVSKFMYKCTYAASTEALGSCAINAKLNASHRVTRRARGISNRFVHLLHVDMLLPQPLLLTACLLLLLLPPPPQTPLLLLSAILMTAKNYDAIFTNIKPITGGRWMLLPRALECYVMLWQLFVG